MIDDHLPLLCVRSKLTLLWGKPRLAWNGYSAGIALILEVDNLLVPEPECLGNTPPRLPPLDAPSLCLSSSAQESQRLPWLPDWVKIRSGSISISIPISISNSTDVRVLLLLVLAGKWTTHFSGGYI